MSLVSATIARSRSLMWYKILWCTHYRKRTHEGQWWSLTVNGGHTYSVITLPALDKSQVQELRAMPCNDLARGGPHSE